MQVIGCLLDMHPNLIRLPVQQLERAFHDASDDVAAFVAARQEQARAARGANQYQAMGGNSASSRRVRARRNNDNIGADVSSGHGLGIHTGRQPQPSRRAKRKEIDYVGPAIHDNGKPEDEGDSDEEGLRV